MFIYYVQFPPMNRLLSRLLKGLIECISSRLNGIQSIINTTYFSLGSVDVGTHAVVENDSLGMYRIGKYRYIA